VIPAGPTSADPPPRVVAVPGVCLTEQARNTFSPDQHSATWRLPLRRLVQPSRQQPDGPALHRGQQRSAHIPIPGAFTVTVGDTGWLAYGRITTCISALFGPKGLVIFDHPYNAEYALLAKCEQNPAQQAQNALFRVAHLACDALTAGPSGW
jgi:hypothetical protein